MENCTEFAFVVPGGCEPGQVLQVRAPDGVPLHIPCPGNIAGGDKLFLGKDAEGQWRISQAVKQAPPSSAQAPAEPTWRTEESLQADLAGDRAVKVELETTKGPIVLQVVASWAPLGAKRFLELVDDGFFADLAVYRAVPDGLVQFGIMQESRRGRGSPDEGVLRRRGSDEGVLTKGSFNERVLYQESDPRNTAYAEIADDPLVGVPFTEGCAAFAASCPGMRKSAICIFLSDFRDQLGYKQPETPFGRILPESQDTLHSLFTGYGDMPQVGGEGPDPEKLEELGNDYIRSQFPKCDFVKSARRLP